MTSTLAQKLSLNELAAKWGWRAPKLYRLCAQKRIPFIRIGHEIFFELPELEVWLAHRRTAVSSATAVESRTRAQECQLLGIPMDHTFS